MARAFPFTERQEELIIDGDSDASHSVLPGYASNVGPTTVHWEPVLGEAQALNQGDLAALETTPALLLVTVILLFQLHIHLPSVVTELRKMEGEYGEDRIFKSRPENDSRIKFPLCLLPNPSTPTC